MINDNIDQYYITNIYNKIIFFSIIKDNNSTKNKNPQSIVIF